MPGTQVELRAAEPAAGAQFRVRIGGVREGDRRGKPRTKSPAAAFSPIAFSTPPMRDAELARRRLGRAQLDLGAGHEALLVEPVQEVSVVLGEADDRRARAGDAAPRAAKSSSFSAISRSGSTGQPCGQRSGWPSFTSIRSTMSSVKVSPSLSAWTCASAAV